MALKDTIRDSVIKMAIRKVIRMSNEKLDFSGLILSSGAESDLHKKLVVRITDMSDNTGLGIKDGKLVEIGEVENPDTVFSMTKNVFSSILLNKLDHKQAYFMGALDADGEDWVRDSLLLGRVFDEIKKVIHSG